MKVRDIPLDKIFITKNVRQEDGELGELMESLGKRQLQPAGVVPRPGDRRGDYELIWGHRRLKALRMANEQTMPCNILDGLSDADIALIKIEENVQRRQLSALEIVEAADEIRRTHPGMADTQIDRMLKKQPGYLSNMRSTVRAAQYLIQHGLKRKAVEALSDDELRGLRADMEAKGEETRGRKSTFHRGERTPAQGFRIVNPTGPNVVVVCSCQDEKQRVLKSLRKLAKGNRA